MNRTQQNYQTPGGAHITASGNVGASTASMSYAIFFSGQLVDGYQADTVKQNLATMFKKPLEQIDIIFSGKPFKIKEQITLPEAQKYQQVFAQAGAICYIEPAPHMAATIILPDHLKKRGSSEPLDCPPRIASPRVRKESPRPSSRRPIRAQEEEGNTEVPWKSIWGSSLIAALIFLPLVAPIARIDLMLFHIIPPAVLFTAQHATALEIAMRFITALAICLLTFPFISAVAILWRVIPLMVRMVFVLMSPLWMIGYWYARFAISESQGLLNHTTLRPAAYMTEIIIGMLVVSFIVQLSYYGMKKIFQEE